MSPQNMPGLLLLRRGLSAPQSGRSLFRPGYGLPKASVEDCLSQVEGLSHQMAVNTHQSSFGEPNGNWQPGSGTQGDHLLGPEDKDHVRFILHNIPSA